MERKAWVEAEWGDSELGRRAKFDRITPRGRRQLAASRVLASQLFQVSRTDPLTITAVVATLIGIAESVGWRSRGRQTPREAVDCSRRSDD
jgi:DNA-binding PadR family transcriptional regulator